MRKTQSTDWLEKGEFENRILASCESEIAVFAATWCGYCVRFLSVISSYTAADPVPPISIVNVDSGDGSLWDEFKIDLVPTLVVFKNGEEIFRRNAKPGSGLKQTDLEESIEAALVRSSKSD